MSYGTNPPRKWSDCSNDDLNDWYRTKGFACFEKDKPRQLSCGPDQLVEVEWEDKFGLRPEFYIQLNTSHFQRLQVAASAFHMAYHSVLVPPCARVIASGTQESARPSTLRIPAWVQTATVDQLAWAPAVAWQ